MTLPSLLRALVGLGLLLVLSAVPTPAPSVAAPLAGLGTPTLPPTATVVPTLSPSAVPTTPTPTATPIAPTPVVPSPTATARPSAAPPEPADEPPSATPVPSATPAPPAGTTLLLTKVADRTTVAPDETITYTLLARNVGAVPAFDVVLTDEVPAALQVIDLFCAKGAIVVTGQQVRAYPGTLSPGETVTMRISVRVRPGTPPGPIPNTAQLTTTTPPEDGDQPVTSTVVVGVVGAPAPPAPPHLPRTAAPPLDADIPVLAAIPPLVWVAVSALLLVLLGVALHWGLRRHQPDVMPARLPERQTVSIPAPSAGPPRLGPALPPAAPPRPLPPLVPLDRVAALRDVCADGEGER